MSGATLINHMPKIKSQLARNAGRLVRRTLFNIEHRAKASMSEPKSGAAYDGHQASAPGEAPAIDDGTLANSMAVVMQGRTAGSVGVGAKHGVYMEMGTEEIEPRPFMAPAAKAEEKRFQAGLKNLI